MHKTALLALSILSFPAQASGTIEVDVANIVVGKGQILLGLCKKEEFLRPQCTANIVAPAKTNPQRIRLDRIPAGEYALQVVYDKNANYRMDTNSFGAPSEPTGFSRDAVGKMGPPRFEDARFGFDGKTARLVIHVY